MTLASKIESLRNDWTGTVSEAVKSILVSKAFGGLSSDTRDELRQDLQHLLDLVTEAHEPRVAIVGDADVSLAPLLDEFLPAGVEGDLDIKSELGHGRWYEWKTPAGTLHLFDGCRETDFKAFRYNLPDVVVQPLPAKMTDDEIEDAIDVFLAVDEVLAAYGSAAPLVATIAPETRGAEDLLAMRTRDRLGVRSDETGLGLHIVIQRSEGELAEAVAPLLPEGARFPWARLTLATNAQERMADNVIALASSIAATLASIPLPLASSVPITTIQILMIGSIVWLSGRERSLKTVGEFLAAVGINVGVGYALRELARALVTLIPVAGSVVSAGIAASATIAVGEAAKRYFLRRK